MFIEVLGAIWPPVVRVSSSVVRVWNREWS
jgi:hypothetical protein